MPQLSRESRSPALPPFLVSCRQNDVLPYRNLPNPDLVARVKKIIAIDEDIAQCSNPAAFAISVATVGQQLVSLRHGKF
jgi:hypothetical protein